MRRRLVGVTLAIVVVAVAVGWWQSRGSESSNGIAGGGAGSETSALHHARALGGMRDASERTIAGVVVGDTGPIRGAVVRLSRQAQREQHVTTDASGAFDFGPQRAGRYVVIADAAGLAPTSVHLDLQDPFAHVDHLKVVLHGCEAWVRGTVRDTGGGTIAHAHVGLDVEGETSAGVDADDAGAFELCVANGPQMLAARADGYASDRDWVVALGRTHHDFTLGPEGTILGHAVRVGGHEPVANAVVTLLDQQGSVVRAVTADETGRFVLDAIAPGPYSLVATADRLATARPVETFAEVGKPHDEVTELGAAYSIQGKVVETGTSTAVPGVEVRVFEMGGLGLRGLVGMTRGDGGFEIPTAPPGRYHVMVNGRAREKAEPVVVEDHDVTVTLEIARLASVSGKVTRGHKPVEGVDVTACAKSTRSDTDGAFTLRGLNPGSCALYAESQRIGAFTQGPHFTLAPGEKKQGIELELELAASIAGTVVDQDGAPAAGVFVRFSLIGGQDYGQVVTADDGSFTARALSGGGSYVYQVSASETSPIHYRAATGARFAPVALADGNSHVTGLRIAVRIERLAIAGRVTDHAGAPVADVEVRAIPDPGYGLGIGTRTDPTGAFEVKGLAAGKYELRAIGIDGQTAEKGIDAGRRGVELHLAGTGSLEGTLAGFTGPVAVIALPESTAAYHPYSATVTGSTFHIDHLPSAGYRVIAYSKSDGDAVSVKVAVGAPAKIALAARGFGTVSGTLRDRVTHEPIANASCFTDSTQGDFVRYLDPKYFEPSKTDGNGAYRVEHVVAGQATISCGTERGYAAGNVDVRAGDNAHLDLLMMLPEKKHQTWAAGMKLQYQLGDLLVAHVDKDSPADRAAIHVGDAVTKANGRAIDSTESYALLDEIQELDVDQLELTVERDNKQLVLTLVRPTSP